MWIYIQTILVYLLVTVSMVTLGRKYVKTDQFGFILLAICIYSIVFSVRYGVGADYFSYLDAYESYARRGQFINDYFEPGFVFLIKILGPFNSSVIFFFVVSFLQLLLYCLCFKEDKQIFPYLFFVFMFTGVWAVHANAMRQVFALGLWSLAIKNAIKKKILVYYLLIGFAYLFHKSAIILVLFYPIIRLFPDGVKSVKIQLILFFCAIGIMTMNLTQDFVTAMDNLIRLIGYDQMDRRADLIEDEVSLGIGFYINAFLNFIVICYSGKIKSFFNNSYLNWIYSLFFIGTLINYIFINSILIGRINMYFYSFNFIVVSYFLLYAVKTHKVRLIVLLGSIIIALFSALIYRAEKSWNLFVFKWQTEYYYLHKGHDDR